MKPLTFVQAGQTFDAAIALLGHDNGYPARGWEYRVPNNVRDVAVQLLADLSVAGWNPNKFSLEGCEEPYDKDIDVLVYGEESDQKRLLKKLGRKGHALHAIIYEIFDGPVSYTVDIKTGRAPKNYR